VAHRRYDAAVLRRLRLVLVLTAVLFGGVAGRAFGEAEPVWAYVTAFRSGRVVVYDVTAEAPVQTIEVRDGAGMAGIAVSRDGRRLFVVDGERQSRLRVFDTRTWTPSAPVAFADRRLTFDGQSPINLSRDGRWAFLFTGRKAAAADTLRVFDVGAGRLLPRMWRDSSCGRPVLSSAPSGAMTSSCPGRIQTITVTPRGGAIVQPGAGVVIDLDEVSAAVMSPDGTQAYVLGSVQADGRWPLVEWNLSAKTLKVHELRKPLAPTADVEAFGRRGFLDISPDGSELGVAYGDRAWILARATLQPVRRYAYGLPVRNAAFSPGGHAFLTLHVLPDRQVEIGNAVRGAERVDRVTVTGLPVDGPVTFAVAPPP